MRNLRSQMALAAILTLMLGAVATADAPFGPKVGAPAPQISPLQDQNGKPQALTQLAGRNGVVLMFFRSARWCPYCQAQLIAMNEGRAEIEKRGYKIVGVSYDTPETNKAFTDRRAITYTLLSDPNSVTIDRWGLRDPQYPPGNMANGVPRPIIFIIDRKGVVRGSLAEETYKSRPPVDEIVKVIDRLK